MVIALLGIHKAENNGSIVKATMNYRVYKQKKKFIRGIKGFHLCRMCLDILTEWANFVLSWIKGAIFIYIRDSRCLRLQWKQVAIPYVIIYIEPLDVCVYEWIQVATPSRCFQNIQVCLHKISMEEFRFVTQVFSIESYTATHF